MVKTKNFNVPVKTWIGLKRNETQTNFYTIAGTTKDKAIASVNKTLKEYTNTFNKGLKPRFKMNYQILKSRVKLSKP